ncbi:MAG: ATP-binding protein [Gemmatimonadota bacterium]
MQEYLDSADCHPIHPGLEAIPDAILMVDVEWRVTYWNAAAERMLGVERNVALGRELWAMVPFLGRTSNRERLNEARRTAESKFLEALPGHGSEVVSVRATASDEGGLTIQISHPDDDRLETEQLLALLESTRSGCVAVDGGWRLVYRNTAAERLLRLRSDDVFEKVIWSFLPDGWEEVEKCLRATMADGLSRHLRGVRSSDRRARDRIYDLRVNRLQGGGLSILFDDVTKRVRRERRLARLAVEAQEANRAKSRFFAAVSHELRTPLNAIIGYTHLLESGTYGALPSKAHRAAVRAGLCAEHLSRLVSDLLVLTDAELRRLTPTYSPVDLASILPPATEVYRHRAEAKGLRFILDLPAEVPELVTDPDRLRQIMVALLSNAVKHTTRGHVSVIVRAAEEYVEIAVVDTGCGIESADQERIFAPFEQGGDPARSNPLAQGSGLGLAVAGKVAALLGGSLRLADSSPSGSSFVLRLPSKPGAAEQPKDLGQLGLRVSGPH